jgi:hypothetical protein
LAAWIAASRGEKLISSSTLSVEVVFVVVTVGDVSDGAYCIVKEDIGR